MKYALLSFIALLGAPLTALAEPTVKIINFTADWCPNCQVLNPKIANALIEFRDAEVELVNLDMTNAGRRSTEEEISEAWQEAVRTAYRHNVLYLWDQYGGITGIAAIVSADTGETITCLNRTFSETEISARLQEALIFIERRDPGSRQPHSTECPPPLRR